MQPTSKRAVLACLVLSPVVVAQAMAQPYPNRPIRAVIPWPAGGITDVITRAVGQQLSESMGQAVVVDNRAGAGGTLGAGIVAKAAADGYTLLFHDIASHCISATLYSRLPYHPLRDFEPIAMVAGSPMVLIANPALKVRTLAQLIELAKSKPGQLIYASSGVGAITHLAPVRLNRITGMNMQHVPFKGSIASATSVISGETAVSFSTIPASLGHAKNGRLVLLAVSFAKRSAQIPDVPTIAETVGEYDLGLYTGAWAPKGAPEAVVQRLSAEIRKALEQPKVKDILTSVSAVPGTMSPKEFGAYLAKEVRVWGEVVRAENLRM
jgi:tripartite-type tricarboxylate transporter receptor subunit TctC